MAVLRLPVGVGILSVVNQINPMTITDPSFLLESECTLEEVLERRTQIAIEECGEPLVEIPPHLFFRRTSHAYISAGAPYDSRSPYFVRAGVLDRLHVARDVLKSSSQQFDIVIFDAFRPRAVQAYMVDHTARLMASEENGVFDELSKDRQKEIMTEVYKVWAKPSSDPMRPPPHSTGAALDLYLVDASGIPLHMGSEIDEITPRALPNYFHRATSTTEKAFHENRTLLHDCMRSAGFRRLTHEWWHFSFGDQMWAYLESLEKKVPVAARYGAAD